MFCGSAPPGVIALSLIKSEHVLTCQAAWSGGLFWHRAELFHIAAFWWAQSKHTTQFDGGLAGAISGEIPEPPSFVRHQGYTASVKNLSVFPQNPGKLPGAAWNV